ncbi:MAG: MATE family efflux transporter [Betaproteobacteria bacterium]|jgi:MATE family multidrug resistance protein|nr:MATE family efflux transporter [Betaproteobacteria bacterium]NBT98636.1 MATE family efflux transporter [Betaproteobacteria bacterium]NCX02156.1 MATE family efflux transporter [Betaproteobacteria bacterium]
MHATTTLRQLIKLAGPVLVSQLAVMANGVIDTMMAGHLSSTELAGLGLGTSIYIIAYVSLLSVLLGLSPIVAQHYGAGRTEAIGDAFRQAFLLAIMLGMVGTLVLIQSHFWSQISGAPSEVASKVDDYLFWCALGVIPALMVRAFSALCTAVSRPRLVMWVNLASLCFKVPLNAIFMYGWGDVGIEPMGAAGAACSTCLLSYGSAIAVLCLAKLDRGLAPYRLLGSLKPKGQQMLELLRLGLPIGGTAFIDVSAFASIALLIAPYGAAASASQQIASSLTGVVYMFSLSLANATMVLTAQRLGSGQVIAAKEVASIGMRTAMLTAALMAGVLLLGKDLLANAYATDPEVAQTAAVLIMWLAIHQWLDSLQLQYAFVLRAHKIASLPFWIYVACLWGIGLGGGAWVSFSGVFGSFQDARAFWWAGILACAAASIALGLLARKTWEAALKAYSPGL